MAVTRRMAIMALALAVGWGQAAEAVAERIQIDHDRDASRVVIKVDAADGEVAWADVARGVARARGFDDAVLADVLPGGGVRVDRLDGQWLILVLDRALSPSIRVAIDRAEGTDEGHDADGGVLRVTLDRAAMLASERRFKARLREAVGASVGRAFGAEEQAYGIDVDGGWADAPADQPLVILVHGFHSEPGRLAALAQACRKAGLATGSFRYPNNRPLDASVELLAEELWRIRRETPERSIALVTASMGGLVARAVIEEPRRDPGNVERLIMIAPPNQGSKMAEFAFALDLTMPIGEAVRQRRVAAFFERLEDGLGEASEDLLPGSAFLRELNKRERNADVAYTVILGTGGPLSEEGLAALRRQLEQAGDRSRFVRFFSARGCMSCWRTWTRLWPVRATGR